MKTAHPFPYQRKNPGSIRHFITVFVYRQCCQKKYSPVYLFFELFLDSYVLRFTSCWFWPTSPISCLTLYPGNLKKKQLLIESPVFCLCHGVTFPLCSAFSRRNLLSVCVCRMDLESNRERERKRERGVDACSCVHVCACADGRQGRLHFLGQASGHLSCPGNPVLAGLLGNNPLLFQMI